MIEICWKEGRRRDNRRKECNTVIGKGRREIKHKLNIGGDHLLSDQLSDQLPGTVVYGIGERLKGGNQSRGRGRNRQLGHGFVCAAAARRRGLCAALVESIDNISDEIGMRLEDISPARR